MDRKIGVVNPFSAFPYFVWSKRSENARLDSRAIVFSTSSRWSSISLQNPDPPTQVIMIIRRLPPRSLCAGEEGQHFFFDCGNGETVAYFWDGFPSKPSYLVPEREEGCAGGIGAAQEPVHRIGTIAFPRFVQNPSIKIREIRQGHDKRTREHGTRTQELSFGRITLPSRSGTLMYDLDVHQLRFVFLIHLFRCQVLVCFFTLPYYSVSSDAEEISETTRKATGRADADCVSHGRAAAFSNKSVTIGKSPLTIVSHSFPIITAPKWANDSGKW